MTVRLLLVNIDKQLTQDIQDNFCLEEIDYILAKECSLALYLARKNLPELIICNDRELSDIETLVAELQSDPDVSSIPIILLASTKFKSSPFFDALSQRVHLISKNTSLDELCQMIAPYLVPKPHGMRQDTTE